MSANRFLFTQNGNPTAQVVVGDASGLDPLGANLIAIDGLTSAADKGIQFTGSGTAATYDLTTAGKALLDDADASAQRTTLGLGTIATLAATAKQDTLSAAVLTEVVGEATDKILIQDTSDSDNLKTITVQDVLDLVPASEGTASFRNLLPQGDFDTNPCTLRNLYGDSITGVNPISAATVSSGTGGLSNSVADMWVVQGSGTAARFTASTPADAPTALQAGVYSKKSLKLDVTTADSSIDINDQCFLTTFLPISTRHKLIGQPITLSFWVKTTVTGIYSLCFIDAISGAANTIGYTTTYTVSAADTWEKKAITLTYSAGDSSYNANTDTFDNIGTIINWGLCGGSNTVSTGDNAWTSSSTKHISPNANVNAVSSTSNNFQIALVQLELGSTETSFERLNAETVKAACGTYCEASNNGNKGMTIAPNIISLVQTDTTTVSGFIPFKYRKGTTPVAEVYTTSDTAGSMTYKSTSNVDTARTTSVTPGAEGLRIVQTAALDFSAAGYYRAAAYTAQQGLDI